MTPAIIAARIRRLALAGSGVTFLVIALIAVVAPRTVARAYAIGVEGVDAHNQFRAVFVGFWLGLATMMITAARRSSEVLLGDLCGVALIAQAAARLLSCAVDGRPSLPFLGAMLGEAAAGVAILAGRQALSRKEP